MLMAALERMGFEVTYIKPPRGYIRPEDVEAILSRYRAGQHYDGQQRDRHHPTHQEIAEIAPQAVDAHRCSAGRWYHSRGCQGLGVDMLSMKRPQVQWPQGHGRAVLPQGIWPQNLIDGGSQEARPVSAPRTWPVSPVWARHWRWRSALWMSGWPTSRCCVTTSSIAS